MRRKKPWFWVVVGTHLWVEVPVSRDMTEQALGHPAPLCLTALPSRPQELANACASPLASYPPNPRPRKAFGPC